MSAFPDIGRRNVLATLFAVQLLATPLAASAEPTAADWLQRMNEASRIHTYDGEFVYAHGGQLGTLRIVHAVDADGREREKLQHMDGGAWEVHRHGNQVTCVYTGSGDGRCVKSGPFSGAFVHDIGRLQANYRLQVGSEGRKAGREAIEIGIRPRDADRYGYQLWLDRESAMLLTCLLKDETGSILERFQFTRLDLRDSIPESEFEIAGDGERRVERFELPEREQGGPVPEVPWQAGWLPEGFAAIKGQAPAAGSAGLRVFSDGLAMISVFVETAGGESRPEGTSRMGATVEVRKKVSAGGGEWFVTVVGEVPERTARRVADAVQVNPG